MDTPKRKVAQYLLLKMEIDERRRLQDKIKLELDPVLCVAEENSRGSKVIKFDEPLRVNGVDYGSLQKIRKESRTLDEDRVYEWLESLPEGTSDDWNIIQSREHIDQDALWHIFCLDLIDEETFNSFFNTSVSWSFSPTKV